MSMPTRADTDAITYAEAARILGCTVAHVTRLVGRAELPTHGQRHSYRRLDRAEVEHLALRRWPPKFEKPESYWITTAEASVILGVIPARVRQLAAAGRLPYEQTASGRVDRTTGGLAAVWPGVLDPARA